MGRFYDDETSLFVEAYDALHDSEAPQLAGDAAFYAEIAHRQGGPVLELACGTGRVTLPLAEAGLNVTGIDRSAAMLSVARRKASALPPETQRRLTLIEQDMAVLNLDRRFGCIFVPFRSFQLLLTIAAQQQALQAMHRHLEPGGCLVLHLFDPRLDLLIDETASVTTLSGTDALSGRRYAAQMVETRLDHVAQIRHDLWHYAEIGPDDRVRREDRREMALRWTYRWELHHLLAGGGFTVDAEYSDFNRSPPAYGAEMIVVAHID